MAALKQPAISKHPNGTASFYLRVRTADGGSWEACTEQPRPLAEIIHDLETQYLGYMRLFLPKVDEASSQNAEAGAVDQASAVSLAQPIARMRVRDRISAKFATRRIPAMNVTVSALASGYFHVRGYGPCNWAQPVCWPCSEDQLRKSAFPEASEGFIRAALKLAESASRQNAEAGAVGEASSVGAQHSSSSSLPGSPR